MDEELRETLTLLSEILEGIGTKMPVDLLNRFLEGGTDETNYLSNSELNEGLIDYIREYLTIDIEKGSSARMVRLGNLYLPLGCINKWSLDEKYSYLENKPQYRIIINSTEQTSNVYSNLIAIYDTKEERQKDIDKLLEMKLSYPQL